MDEESKTKITNKKIDFELKEIKNNLNKVKDMLIDINGSTKNLDASFTITYINAMLAGIVLGIAGVAYLSVISLFTPVYSTTLLTMLPLGKFIASFMFAFGLVTIVNRKYWLYTGAIGKINFSNSAKRKRYLIVGLFSNLLMLWLVACFTKCINPELIVIADSLMLNKLSLSWIQILCASIGCGVCMYLGVTTDKDYLTILAVMIFILCGFEHVLADWFYLCVSSYTIFSINTIKFFILALIGNTIGANVTRIITGDLYRDI